MSVSSILDVKHLQYQRVDSGVTARQGSGFHLGPVSFSLAQGETLAIIGENRSGKSLLSKLLVGAVEPTQGQILLDGKDVAGQAASSNIRRLAFNQQIRLVLQHQPDVLNPAISVEAQLDHTLQLNTSLDATERQSKIITTLMQVGLLQEHRYYYRHMLSEGQQQRVALARAMILDPQIIVADEPFAALDPSVRSQTVNLILSLQRTLGLGFVFISHNLGVVRHVSDRVMVLDEGQVVEYGPTREVFDQPQQAVTKRLIESHFSLVAEGNSLDT